MHYVLAANCWLACQSQTLDEGQLKVTAFVCDMSYVDGTASLAAAGCGTHTVAPGDTLFDIAKAKGVALSELQAANPGVVPEQLGVGQTLQLPCGPGGKPATWQTLL
jgi:LysM repeat protein